jgi:hypothetical protein
VAAAVGMLAGPPALLLLLPMLGVAAALRLRHAYGGEPAGAAASRCRLHGPPPSAVG